MTEIASRELRNHSRAQGARPERVARRSDGEPGQRFSALVRDRRYGWSRRVTSCARLTRGLPTENPEGCLGRVWSTFRMGLGPFDVERADAVGVVLIALFAMLTAGLAVLTALLKETGRLWVPLGAPSTRRRRDRRAPPGAQPDSRVGLGARLHYGCSGHYRCGGEPPGARSPAPELEVHLVG